MYQILQSTGSAYYLDLIIAPCHTKRLYYGHSALQCLSKIQIEIPLRILPDAILNRYFNLTKNGMVLRNDIDAVPRKRGKVRGSVLPRHRKVTVRRVHVSSEVKEKLANRSK